MTLMLTFGRISGGNLSRRRLAFGLPVAGAALILFLPITAAAAFANPAQPPLATAAAFTVLAGSAVTNTGPTVISADKGIGGNLGVSPGTSITGFPPGIVDPPGAIHSADAVAQQAETDRGTAAVNLAGRTPDVVFPPVHDLVGQTLTAGVYNDPTSLALSGALTLDAQGDPDAVFIFQAGSTLITSTSSSVVLSNGAQACNVFWQIGSSATLGTDSSFNGTIIAAQSVTVGTAVDLQGRALAGTGAVTLDSDRINTPACAPSNGVAQAPLLGRAAPPVAVVAFVLGAGVLVLRRRRSFPPLTS
jgi:hypothetical protein